MGVDTGMTIINQLRTNYPVCILEQELYCWKIKLASNVHSWRMVVAGCTASTCNEKPCIEEYMCRQLFQA